MKFKRMLNEGRTFLYKKSIDELKDYFFKTRKLSKEETIEAIDKYLYSAENKYKKDELKNVILFRNMLGYNDQIKSSVENKNIKTWTEKDLKWNPKKLNGNFIPEHKKIFNTFNKMGNPSNQENIENLRKKFNYYYDNFYKDKITQKEYDDLINKILTPEKMKEISDRFYDGSQLQINLCLDDGVDGNKTFYDLFESGKLKNQYETKHSLGAWAPYVGSCRDFWEKNIFNGILHKTKTYKELDDDDSLYPVAKERPIYGYVSTNSNIYSEDENLRSNYINQFYGNTTFILKNNVKRRSTFVDGNSSGLDSDEDMKRWGGHPPTKKGSVSYGNYGLILTTIKSIFEKQNIHIVKKYLNELINEKTPLKPRTNNNLYFESQIIGGVDLSKDVDKIVIQNNKKDSLRHFKRALEISKKYNIPIYMFDEQSHNLKEVDEKEFEREDGVDND